MNTENHQKVSYKEGKEWDFCIKFDCDGCVFRDNISEISFNLLNNPDDIKTIIIYQNHLYCYTATWGLVK